MLPRVLVARPRTQSQVVWGLVWGLARALAESQWWRGLYALLACTAERQIQCCAMQGEPGGVGGRAGAIAAVAFDRHPQPGEVNADLMAMSAAECDGDEDTYAAIGMQRVVDGQGHDVATRGPSVGAHGHRLPPRAATQRQLESQG